MSLLITTPYSDRIQGNDLHFNFSLLQQHPRRSLSPAAGEVPPQAGRGGAGRGLKQDKSILMDWKSLALSYAFIPILNLKNKGKPSRVMSIGIDFIGIGFI